MLRLVDAFPRLLVVRTFSKIYGLSGLRAGYAVGSSASTALLDRIAPVLGVNALTQAAVDQALKIGGAEVQRRREAVIRERAHLVDSLRKLPLDVSESQANFLWIRARSMSGNELANRLRERGVIVAPGGPLGEDQHVRATVRDEAASARLLKALGEVLAERPRGLSRGPDARPRFAKLVSPADDFQEGHAPSVRPGGGRCRGVPRPGRTGAAARRWSARGCGARRPCSRAPPRSA